MDVKDYKFKVGDPVVTVYGETGKIDYICECTRCKERGFNEPQWVNDDDPYECGYITDYDFKNNFPSYYQIGEYRFNRFNKDYILSRISELEKELESVRKNLKVIEELEEKENDSKRT